MRNWHISQSTVGIIWCLIFLIGLGLGRLEVDTSIWLCVIFSVWAVLLRRTHRVLYVALGALAFLIFGISRGSAYMNLLQPYTQVDGQKVLMLATVDSDAVYGTKKQLTFTVGQIQFVSPFRSSPPGTVKVSGFGELAIYKGDKLQIEGKILRTRGSNQAVIYFAQFHRIGGNSSIIDEFRRRFNAGVQTALPEPIASFGMGLLVGQRSTLPQHTQETLKMVGLMHIVAVSGYNLTIILNSARRVLQKYSKRLTVFVAITLMSAFLLCTGMSASIVRATVVSTLGLVAWYVGRRVRPELLILLAAAITAGVYPVYLWSDIGWWLSFLAFYGVLVLAPLFTALIWRKSNPSVVIMIAIETLCAELMTIPLILYIFGQVSTVGLVANVLVGLLIPWAMALTFVAGIVGWLLPLLSGWFSWPAKILLTYMLDISEMLSRVPHAFKRGLYISMTDMLGMYIATFLIVIILKRQKLNLQKHLAKLGKYY